MVETSAVLLAAALAWLFTIASARDMGVMPGTMGLGLAGFLGTWALMMAAMMRPSVAPVATLYARMRKDHRARRVASLSIGYLSVWACTALVAFGLAAGGDRLAREAPGWAQGAAVASCLACGAYQMTALKDRCLQHCRSPLGHLIRYGSFRGRLSDFRVGAHHGAWCLACCWSLMLLMITFGVMNIVAMVVLACVILIEKVTSPGRWLSVAIGLASIGLAIAIWIHPALAPGLHVGSREMAAM